MSTVSFWPLPLAYYRQYASLCSVQYDFGRNKRALTECDGHLSQPLGVVVRVTAQTHVVQAGLIAGRPPFVVVVVTSRRATAHCHVLDTVGGRRPVVTIVVGAIAGTTRTLTASEQRRQRSRQGGAQRRFLAAVPFPPFPPFPFCFPVQAHLRTRKQLIF